MVLERHDTEASVSTDGKPLRFKVDHSSIYDSATRYQTLTALLRELNLSPEDSSILLFSILGNTPGKSEPSLPDILKKIQLPRVNAKKYDIEKLKRYITMLGNELKALDKDYGILSMDTLEVQRLSRNGKYVTLYGFKLLPVTYRNLIRLLTENPGYVISVLLGIYESIKAILKFLEVEK